MKIKFCILVLTLLIITISTPKRVLGCSPCNYPVVDHEAVAEITKIVQNGIQQTKLFININNMFEHIINVIGPEGLSAFDFVKNAIGGNFGSKVQPIKEIPVLTEWGLTVEDYENADLVSAKIAEFLKREQDLIAQDFRSKVALGQRFLADAASDAFSIGIVARADANQMTQSAEDLKKTVTQSSTIRDDLVSTNLIALSNAYYFQQILDLYANQIEVSTAVVIKDAALDWEENVK